LLSKKVAGKHVSKESELKLMGPERQYAVRDDEEKTFNQSFLLMCVVTTSGHHVVQLEL